MEYKEFNTNLANLNTYLDDHGVAVIPNVLTEAECISLRNDIWKELKYVTKNRFDINDISTWRNFYDFYSSPFNVAPTFFTRAYATSVGY